ncbi:hypothetical protein TCAL_17189 [Tigriopus californicus]|uniref:Uncharacterized protein n=1 Tax=Tigriopus californicus TaxID=6832 RepID=A0A553N8F1_TIGCA|nr:hypothetical protein TCAL_17189 [Tigriopus californicus]
MLEHGIFGVGDAEAELEIERLQGLLVKEVPLNHAEVLHGRGTHREFHGGAHMPQFEELGRELVAHEATHIRVVLIHGHGLSRRLGDFEQSGVGLHIADLEASEVDAVDVGLGLTQIVLGDFLQPEHMLRTDLIHLQQIGLDQTTLTVCIHFIVQAIVPLLSL